MKNIITATLLLCTYCLTTLAQEDYKDINTKTKYTNETPYLVKEITQNIRTNKTPKNIILMIGDGMGTAHLYAGLTANRGQLYIQNMKYMGLSKTHSSDKYVTDSAAGGTALSTGKKTNNGTIGMDKDGKSIPTFLEKAEAIGKATGLVSTSAITHATPASFVAHQPKRSMYEEIAADFMFADVDVIIGGGYSFFSKRTDKRDLFEELESKGYTTSRTIDQVRDFESGKLLVLTADEHNPAYNERGDMLPQATELAINVLQKNSKKGFFLMVEGSQIDWGAHQNDIKFVVEEMLDFDRAVGEALKFAEKDGETLVIVTADHETGGLTLIDGNESTGMVQASFSTGHHTGVGVPVFAYGCGAESFTGIYENTAIYHKMAKLWKY